MAEAGKSKEGITQLVERYEELAATMTSDGEQFANISVDLYSFEVTEASFNMLLVSRDIRPAYFYQALGAKPTHMSGILSLLLSYPDLAAARVIDDDEVAGYLIRKRTSSDLKEGAAKDVTRSYAESALGYPCD